MNINSCVSFIFTKLKKINKALGEPNEMKKKRVRKALTHWLSPIILIKTELIKKKVKDGSLMSDLLELTSPSMQF